MHELKARPHKAWGFEPQELVDCRIARRKCARGVNRILRATLQVALPFTVRPRVETLGFVRLCLQHNL